MKKSILLLMILCSISVVTFAQKPEEKVAQAVEFLKQALISGNKADLEKIALPELTYGHSSGKIQDKTEFVETLVSGKSDFVTIDLKDQTIKVVGNTAIVRHLLYAKTNDSGNPGEVKLGIMLVFVKHDGEWKLLARQAYKI